MQKCLVEMHQLVLHLVCLDAHVSALLLSQNSRVGCQMGMEMDACRCLMKCASHAESDSATISASAELSAMECCWCEPQMTAPPCIMKILPLVD